MNLFRWIWGFITLRGKALWLYRNGMQQANANQLPQAIASYSQVVEMGKGPADVHAMARYNRALVHATLGNETAAMEDLDFVLGMRKAPARIKSAAKQRRYRMTSQPNRNQE